MPIYPYEKESGSGKSTTIQAIATYFGRNLKNTPTDQNLQVMFEYVNKNAHKSAATVFEEINAMADVAAEHEALSKCWVKQPLGINAKLNLE